MKALVISHHYLSYPPTAVFGPITISQTNFGIHFSLLKHRNLSVYANCSLSVVYIAQYYYTRIGSFSDGTITQLFKVLFEKHLKARSGLIRKSAVIHQWYLAWALGAQHLMCGQLQFLLELKYWLLGIVEETNIRKMSTFKYLILREYLTFFSLSNLNPKMNIFQKSPNF